MTSWSLICTFLSSTAFLCWGPSPGFQNSSSKHWQAGLLSNSAQGSRSPHKHDRAASQAESENSTSVAVPKQTRQLKPGMAHTQENKTKQLKINFEPLAQAAERQSQRCMGAMNWRGPMPYHCVSSAGSAGRWAHRDLWPLTEANESRFPALADHWRQIEAFSVVSVSLRHSALWCFHPPSSSRNGHYPPSQLSHSCVRSDRCFHAFVSWQGKRNI